MKGIDISFANVIGAVAGLGADQVVSDIIDATAPEETKFYIKILRKIGCIAIGWLVGDLISNHVEKVTGEIQEAVKKCQEAVEESTTEVIDISNNNTKEDSINE